MTLFQESEGASLSPRAQWMRENKVTVEQDGDQWVAANSTGSKATADTKDDALNALAQWMYAESGVKPWNLQ